MSEAETLDRYADRRRHFRRPTHRSAALTLRNGENMVDCTVIDESDGGVQVDLGEEVDLPDELVIRFSDEASQLVRRCWSMGTKIGYQFIDPAPAVATQIKDVPPPVREAMLVGDYACITPAALGLDLAEMAFVYTSKRINALLRDELRLKAAIGLRVAPEQPHAPVPEMMVSFFGPKWRVFHQT